MFIAKISAGRTVREFIGGTMAAPVVYTCIWLVIFGGSGFVIFVIFGESYLSYSSYLVDQVFNPAHLLDPADLLLTYRVFLPICLLINFVHFLS